MPEQDVASIDMLEAQLIQDEDSSLDESQPVSKLFPDPEPVDKTQQEPGTQAPQPAPNSKCNCIPGTFVSLLW
jgi:hypothetical protein